MSDLPTGEAIMSELKPCPFCGGESVSDSTLKNDSYPDEWSSYVFTVKCTKCFASTDEFPHTDGDEIKAWNTRATPAGTIITEDDFDTCPENGQDIVYRFLYVGGGHSVPYAMEWHDSEMSALIEDDGVTCIWWPIPEGMFQPPTNGGE